MGAVFVNLDRMFSQLETPPIILNDQTILTKEGREQFDRLLFTQYSDDILSPTPTCECGAIRGRYKLNCLCSICQTKVSEPVKTDIVPLVWMRPPQGIPSFISPGVWYMLTSRLRSEGYSWVNWMCDPYYRVANGTIPQRLIWMLEQGHQRSYTYFVNNMALVLKDLVFGDGRRNPHPQHVILYELIVSNIEDITPKYVPIPSKVAFVIEESGGGRWVDKAISPAIEAIRRMQETEQVIETLSIRSLESRMTRILNSLGEFYFTYFKDNFDGKNKIMRKHIFGARLHFTARAVITSITDNHNKSELHYPWGMSLQLFKLHIANKLIRRGYSAEGAIQKINGHAHRYDAELDQIFQELILESPYMGLPVLFQRNPTLSRASAQLLYVTKVKPDPADNTISNSILAISGSNADTLQSIN